jgi:hypothetical protein
LNEHLRIFDPIVVSEKLLDKQFSTRAADEFVACIERMRGLVFVGEV